jgi:hypothetical protein
MMSYVELKKKQREYGEEIQQAIEIRYPDLKLLYHGTSVTNAKSLKDGVLERVPNYELADQLCSQFNTSLEKVKTDPSTEGFFSDFVFANSSGKSRENEIYTATRVHLAGSYASRGPEWKYHLLIYFGCKELGIPFNVTNYIESVEKWVSTQVEQPAIVVFDATNYPNFPEENEFMRHFSEGETLVLDYPLPQTVEFLEFFEWNFPKGASA